MPTALHQSSFSDQIGFSANTDRYTPVGAGATLSSQVFENQVETIHRTPGVWSQLWCRVTNNTNDQVGNVFSRVNNADGNQTFSIAAATTGIFQDSSNTDAISAGDILAIRVRASHSTASLSGLRITLFQSLFNPTAAERVYRLTAGNQNIGVTGFNPCMTSSPCDPTESPLQIHIPGGTVRNGAQRVSLNTRNGASTLVLRVNELDTALTISIAASTSGVFEDLVNTVTVFDRDRMNWHFTLGGTSGFFFSNYMSLDLVTTVFFGGGSRTDAGIDLKGAGLPAEIDGLGPHSGFHDQVLTADESTVQGEALVTDTWEGIIVVIPTNGQDGSCEWRSRVNGADSTLTVTVAAFTTGIFESTGASIAVTPTTLINLRRLTNGTNPDALNYFTHNFFGVGGAPPAATTLLGGIYRLIPARTRDTLYTGFGPTTTQDNKIPDPFFRTGMVGD